MKKKMETYEGRTRGNPDGVAQYTVVVTVVDCIRGVASLGAIDVHIQPGSRYCRADIIGQAGEEALELARRDDAQLAGRRLKGNRQ